MSVYKIFILNINLISIRLKNQDLTQAGIYVELINIVGTFLISDFNIYFVNFK